MGHGTPFVIKCVLSYIVGVFLGGAIANMNQSKATWLFAFFLWVSRRSDPKGAYGTEAEAQKARLPNPCLGFVFQPGLAGGVIP